MTKDNLKSLAVYAFGILGAFAIFAVLVNSIKTHSAPPAINASRIAERSRALSETKALAEQELSSYAKIDAAKALYRLKIGQAMTLTEQMYRSNADAARSNLVARAEKANFVPPPPTFE